MKKYIVLLLIFLILIHGCTESSNLSNTASLNITIKDVTIQKNKSVKNGMLVSGKIITKDVTNSQIKPIALKIIKRLQKEYPKCEWFIIWMSDDERMYDVGNYIAMAEYKEGNVNIQGGVPLEKEIIEYNTHSFEMNKKLGPPYICLMVKPTEYNMNVYSEFFKLKQDAFKKGTYTSDDKIDLLLSKKTNIPVKEIKNVHCGINSYYMLKFHNKL